MTFYICLYIQSAEIYEKTNSTSEFTYEFLKSIISRPILEAKVFRYQVFSIVKFTGVKFVMHMRGAIWSGLKPRMRRTIWSGQQPCMYRTNLTAVYIIFLEMRIHLRTKRFAVYPRTKKKIVYDGPWTARGPFGISTHTLIPTNQIVRGQSWAITLALSASYIPIEKTL